MPILPGSRHRGTPSPGPDRRLSRAAHLAPWLFLLASVLPTQLHAQARVGGQTTEGTTRWHGSLLGGSDGIGRNAHMFGGFEAIWLPGRLGAAGGLQVGYGNGYRSSMAVGGLALQGLDLSGIRLHAWLGPAYYIERLDADIQRSVLGAGGGAHLYRLMGRWSFGLHLSGFAGSFKGPDFTETAPVRSTRLAIGVGYGGVR